MSDTKSNPLKRFLLWLSGAPDEPARPTAVVADGPDVQPSAAPAEEAPQPLGDGAGPAAAAAEGGDTAAEPAGKAEPEAEQSVPPADAAAAAGPAPKDGQADAAVQVANRSVVAAVVEKVNDATGFGVAVVAVDVAVGQPYWRAMLVHHLTPEENHGNHHIFLDALDEQGARLPGARGRVTWDGGEQVVTVDKPAGEPGTNFPMWKWQVCTVEMLDLPSDRVTGLHTGHPDEPPGMGNTLFHHSFAVQFQRAVISGEPGGQPAGSGSVISGTVTGAAGETLLLTREGEIVAKQMLDTTGAFRFEGLVAGDYVLAVEGTGAHTGVITVDGKTAAQANLAADVVRAATGSRFIDRYFLFGAPNSARTAVYLDLARSYLLSRQPTFGFRVSDALHAEQVVIMGAVEDIPQTTEDTLRQAGCQVVRIEGTPQQIQDALRQMDIGGHQVFFPIVPTGG